MFDRKKYRELSENAETIREAVRSGEKKLNTFESVMQDFYSMLYKPVPKIKNVEEVGPEHVLNHSLVNSVENMREYKNMREYTTMDPTGSAIGTVALSESIKDKIPDDIAREVNKADFIKRNIHSLIEKIEKEGVNEEFMQKLSEKKNALKAMKDKIGEMVNSPGTQAIMRSSIREAEKETRDVLDFLSGCGSEDGEKIMMDPYAALNTYNLIKDNENIIRIAEKVGRFANLAKSRQSTKVTKEPDEYMSIELGGDISRVLPAEMARMRHPSLKKMFYMDFLQGNLMQYSIKPKEEKNKGPIVCCVDVSGSMRGDKDAWAKGFALGLKKIADIQKRPFYAIMFSTKTWSKELTNARFDEAIQFLTMRLGGGTDFFPPIKEAIHVMEDYPDYGKSDIVFITDGQAPLRDIKWIEDKKKELGFKVYTVGIQCHPGSHLMHISDEHADIENLILDDDAIDIYGKM